ncbi:hypothetical protein NML43_21595 [Rhodopseudomonas palustris]|uniref:hypothetical protein n=1 Tax=Rhodopseudomonas palustris TaxID=1076 RepID=UPI0020CCD96A|nr:hypothetical protein [Rhodopseudomonas palustris]MCP9629692.1 hypothetical protein [Rhodopseudomonas palustris]
MVTQRLETMRLDRNSDHTTFPTALRLWLNSALLVCALIMIAVGTASSASAASDAPRQQLEFVKTPPAVPAPSLSDEPEVTTTDTAQALTPSSSRSMACDQSTRVRLQLDQPMLGRSEPPQLRPPICV